MTTETRNAKLNQIRSLCEIINSRPTAANTAERAEVKRLENELSR